MWALGVSRALGGSTGAPTPALDSVLLGLDATPFPSPRPRNRLPPRCRLHPLVHAESVTGDPPLGAHGRHQYPALPRQIEPIEAGSALPPLCCWRAGGNSRQGPPSAPETASDGEYPAPVFLSARWLHWGRAAFYPLSVSCCAWRRTDPAGGAGVRSSPGDLLGLSSIDVVSAHEGALGRPPAVSGRRRTGTRQPTPDCYLPPRRRLRGPWHSLPRSSAVGHLTMLWLVALFRIGGGRAKHRTAGAPR